MKQPVKPAMAIVAAAAALLFVTVGSASATVLCKAAESPCSSLNRYPLGTQLSYKMTEGKLLMKTQYMGIPWQSGESLEWWPKGKTSTEGSLTTTVEGKHETVFGCPCVGVLFLGIGGYSIHHITGTANGQFTMSGFQVLLNGQGFECTYGGTFVAGTLTGGNPATMQINGTVPYISGSGCPGTMSITSGPIKFEAPAPLYVAAS